MPYSFGYAVSDGPSYNNYAHQETADTKAVTGSYRVALPDGRTQIVTYKADDNGYVANVKYEGQAKYPENYSKPKPAYQPGPPPPPAYKPATPIKPYKPWSDQSWKFPPFSLDINDLVFVISLGIFVMKLNYEIIFCTLICHEQETGVHQAD